MQEGGLILGVCGGFQMLGTRLSDPDHIESPIEEIEGLGFIQATTIMEHEKITRRRIRVYPLPPLFSSRDWRSTAMKYIPAGHNSKKSIRLLFQPSNGDCSSQSGIMQ